jgi:hypothetical protein
MDAPYYDVEPQFVIAVMTTFGIVVAIKCAIDG